MTPSEQRIKTFVDRFIRRDDIQPSIQELYLSDPERADRMDAAAESGADGSTHYEVIHDWREAFERYIRYGRQGYHQVPERFVAAVEAHFDATEAWHEANGSLLQEIG